MSDRDALLRSILEHPQEDLPRLVYADWLDDAGEVELAEFVRVQVELARDPDSGGICECGGELHIVNLNSYPVPISRCSRCRKDNGHWRPFILRHREKELWHQLPTHKVFAPWSNSVSTDPKRTEFWLYNQGGPLCKVSRGFVSSVTLDWASWLRHHAGLFWSSRQTTHCELCFPLAKHLRERCTRCSGTGRIPRPFVPTAQPLETVIFTDWMPRVENIRRGNEPESFFTVIANDDKRITFTRMKCGVCIDHPSHICPSCHGNPLNRWTCPEWPGVGFVMPEDRHG